MTRVNTEHPNQYRRAERQKWGIALLAGVAAFSPRIADAQEDTTVLDPVVVTASGFEQTVNDAPASVTVVTREELEKGAFRDLTDALREVQGVTVTGVANERDIYMRGLPGNYTLILVDGKRQSTRETRPNGSAGLEQSFIPPLSAIERIEVVRGPMSSLYGSDAMGGVINIITRKVGQEWSGSITTEGSVQQHSKFGNNGEAYWYLSGPLVEDTLGLQAWGSGLRRGEDEILSGAMGEKNFDLAGRLTWTPNENHDILLEAGRERIRREQTDGNSLPDMFPENYNIATRERWSLSHTGRWGATTSDVSIQQEWSQFDMYSLNGLTNRFDRNPRHPEIRNTTIDASLTTPFYLFGDHMLVTGGQYFEARLNDENPGRRTGQTETFSATQWALFAEDEWQMFDTFALTAGLRMDDHEKYGSQFSPRIYGVWNATEELTIKGGISTGFRAPDIRQIAPGYALTTGGRGCTYGPTGTCGVIIGAPDLEAEKSTSYEVSAIWDNGSDMVLSGTYFYTDFRDKIDNARVLNPDGTVARWSEDPNYQLWYSYNVDDAVIQGVELAATWYATLDLTFRASYTYTHSEQKTGTYAGYPLARTPAHAANIRADWVTPVEGLTAWANGNYHGAEKAAGLRIGTNGSPITINGQAGREYDPYATLDFGVQYAVNDSVTMGAAIYNAFDKKVEANDYNALMEGRRLWLSMKAEF